jgi:exoribonuclease-2
MQIVNQPFQKDNLVLYKSYPARVITLLEGKIEIELGNKEKLKVREKDITLLHRGPITDLAHLQSPPGEIEEARELLCGSTVTLPELAEMVYGSYTPSSAWAAYTLVRDGLHFYGTIDKIEVRSTEQYRMEARAREVKAADIETWNSFIQRLRQGTILEDDKKRLSDVEALAWKKNPSSRILRELNIQISPEHAHRFLLKLGHWDNTVNPYLDRFGISVSTAYPELSAPPEEERLDLTRLEAFAIDDEGNNDPDDAISIEGNRLWVHVADVASVVKPGTPVDVLARMSGSTVYLPERTITMLPSSATAHFGLGLQRESVALSFCLEFDEKTGVTPVMIRPSRVCVTRLTYAQVEERLTEAPFDRMVALTQRYHDFRKSKNAVFINFPEVKIKVCDGVVSIKPLPALKSRDLVTEAMLMAGEAAARFALVNKIAFPFTTQPPPETIETPQDLAAMFSYRKQLKPGQIKTSAEPHAGLGIDAYSRVTSPLRRYSDLIAHQQLRAFLRNQKVLDEQEIVTATGTYSANAGTAQIVERLSNQHWTLVYLLQNPEWKGAGIVVDKHERFTVVLIPELGLETRLAAAKNVPLNGEMTIGVSQVDIPALTAHFYCVE